MRKGIKKLLNITLIAAMTMSIATGCGKKNDTKSNIASDENKQLSIEELAWDGSRADETVIDDKYGSCYQVFVYSFCDSDGDGIGDFKGLESKLDYIKDMGFDSIWMLPINQAGSYHKYDVIDYYSVDKEYGTMEDFESLVKSCDEKGIDLYMDFVINHSSIVNQWFKDASSYIKTLGDDKEIDYAECPYAEYYNFAKSNTSLAGYSKVPGTKNWYYEARFAVNMPDLNLESENVRKEIEKIAKFWIDKGIKGFRLDAALHYSEGNNDKSTESLKWFCDYVYSVNPDLYIVAEVWDASNTIAKFYESGIDSLFNFPLADKGGLVIKNVLGAGNGSCGTKIGSTLSKLDEAYRASNENYIDGLFISNHDTGRAAGFLARVEDKIKMAAGIEMMLSGKAFVYYGEELGMSGSGDDRNKRAPMYWTEDSNAQGMTKGPQGYEVQEHKFGSLLTQSENANSIFNYYKKALHIRNKYPEIARGTQKSIDQIDSQNGNVFALEKNYNDDKINIIFNVNKESVTLDISSIDGVVVDYLTTTDELPILNEKQMTIPAYGIVVIK